MYHHGKGGMAKRCGKRQHRLVWWVMCFRIAGSLMTSRAVSPDVILGLILGLVPRICPRQQNRTLADAWDRPSMTVERFFVFVRARAAREMPPLDDKRGLTDVPRP
ncbi:hypothetical protein ACO34A_25700 (plasmid) [Rhizobium sp. ACO-34A]|nr:hypothetical protein ACO34A_25700 [Rhizobium sp. ACO-34A]